MNLKYILALIFLSICSHSQTSIETKKVDNIITKHGFKFNDEYSWLEKMDSEETRSWVNNQNSISSENYSKVKKKVSTIEKLKIYNSETTGSASINFKKGLKFYYWTENPKESPLLFLQRDQNSKFIEVFNPNKIYKKKNVSIDNFSTSLNSKYLSCALRINGSDRLEVRFVDLNSTKMIKDSLTNVKFSNISWNKDEGVFYKLNINKSHFARDSTYKVFYHKLNTPQSNDAQIFDGIDINSEISFYNDKSMFFLIEKNEKLFKKRYYYADLNKEKFELILFHEDVDNSFDFISYHKGRIYYTSKKYNWGEVRSFDLNNKENDKQIIPQYYNNLIIRTDFTEKNIICK